MKTPACMAIVVAMTMTACDQEATMPDSGRAVDAGTDAGGSVCERDLDCADPEGRFCVVYRCRPGEGDARGCVDMGSPCDDGMSCDEVADRCVSSTCDGDTDVDEDGHDRIECGEDDCDDNDGDRFPGNPEVCDAAGHDEDCRPDTFAGASDGDRDGDGVVSDQCCQLESAGTLACGGDCDDTNDAVRPSASEICNGIDDNCNGMIDEGVIGTVYRDQDADNYGDRDVTMSVCFDSVPDGYVIGNTDCDDGDGAIHPNAIETCNGADDDCDGVIDENTDNSDIGGREHCTACGDECQFICSATGCDLPQEVAAGASHACARLASGAVYCWGDNDDGQLGVGHLLSVTGPTRVVEIPTATSIAAISDHTLAATATSTWGWGLLPQTDSPDATPIVVDNSDPDDLVAAGLFHGCVRSNVSGVSRIVCWGASGLLGRGGNFWVDGIDNAISLSLVQTHSCVVRATGSVDCWGAQCYVGQLGSSIYDQATPAPVAGISGARTVAVGALHTCALRSSGTIACWGATAMIGDGEDSHQSCTGGSCSYSPREVTGITTAVYVDAGETHTCAVLADGTLRCWGLNFGGALGDGTTDDSNVPVSVVGLTGVTDVDAGSGHTCAIADDLVYCWGNRGEFVPTRVPPPL